MKEVSFKAYFRSKSRTHLFKCLLVLTRRKNTSIQLFNDEGILEKFLQVPVSAMLSHIFTTLCPLLIPFTQTVSYSFFKIRSNVTPSRKYFLMLPDCLDALSLPSLPQAPLGIFLMGALPKFQLFVFLLEFSVYAVYLCILGTKHMQ